MKNYVDRAFAAGRLVRPTQFIPNGCGPKAGKIASVLIPNELLGVDYSKCCNLHDLEYYRGGFLGLFWRKPKADFLLGRCMARQFSAAAKTRWRRGDAAGRVQGVATFAAGVVTAPIYFAAVTILGWTPFTWRLKRRAVSITALHRLKRAE